MMEFERLEKDAEFGAYIYIYRYISSVDTQHRSAAYSPFHAAQRRVYIYACGRKFMRPRRASFFLNERQLMYLSGKKNGL